jgi:uncharacterized protein (DUF362 family)
MSVPIKPNAIVGGSPGISCRGITTSPVVFKELIRILREKGAGKLVIAEGPIELPSRHPQQVACLCERSKLKRAAD